MSTNQDNQNSQQNDYQNDIQTTQNSKDSKPRAGNQKNTYIKKINTLIDKHNSQVGGNQIPHDIEQGGNKVKRNKSLIPASETEDKDQLKLARNRESARNSRKRKKIYLELLENKVTQLNDFLATSKKINQSSEDLLNNLQTQIQYKNELSSQKQVLFRNMQMALQSNTTQININGIIDSLKNKFGTVNKERLLVLDYCYKQIAEQILPIHMQYILYACMNKKDIFEENNPNSQKQNLLNQEKESKEEEEFPNIIKNLDFNEKQKKRCIKLSKRLTKEKLKMDQMLSQLYEAKEQMKNELKSLDDTFQELRKDFEPSLIGKFLMEIEKFQYSKNMKPSFDKFFSSKHNNVDLPAIDKSDDEDEEDFDSDGDLYEFIKSEDSCNNLMVDINNAYDVYVDAYDFLSQKQQMQKEEKQQQSQQQQAQQSQQSQQ